MEVQSRICKFGNDHILIVSSGDKKPYYIKKRHKLMYVNDHLLNCDSSFYYENTCVFSIKKVLKEV